MCVIGNEMAGKTTFVNSLLQLGLPPVDPKDRTAGIQIYYRIIPGVGRGTTWDFGAQLNFQKAHGLFFRNSNTMFVLVLPIEQGKRKSEKDLLEEGQFWCAFVKASLQTRPRLLRLFLVINLIGFREKVQPKLQLERIVHILQKTFQQTFQICHVMALDCSDSHSVEMTTCREKLRKIREEMLKVMFKALV